MAVRKRNHPDREECLRILSKIDTKIPERYATRVKEILIEKQVDEIPTQRQILNIRNGRIYDLEVVKALEIVAEEAELEKRQVQKHRNGQLSIESANK